MTIATPLKCAVLIWFVHTENAVFVPTGNLFHDEIRSLFPEERQKQQSDATQPNNPYIALNEISIAVCQDENNVHCCGFCAAGMLHTRETSSKGLDT